MKKTAKKTDTKVQKKAVGISIEPTKEEKAKKNSEQNKDTKEENKVQEEKKPLIKFNLDFIYRREKYTLNLKNNCLVSFLKRKIGEKINVEVKNLKFYYKETELKNDADKKNVYDMIKNDKNVPFIDVKKEIPISQDIISLSTKSNLIYKVECKHISSYRDLIEKIEKFCTDSCIDKNYLCEPVSTDTYYACFSCSDHCFQFKRYMMNIARQENDKKAEFKIMEVDKSRIIEPKIEQNVEDTAEYGKVEDMVVKDKNTDKNITIKFRKIKHKEDDYFQKDFLNSGPNIPNEPLKGKDKSNKKKKWNI